MFAKLARNGQYGRNGKVAALTINPNYIIIMKPLILAVILTLTGCGTVGGAVSGAGKDLTSLGNLISK